jgi:hypothetical protein
MDSLLVLPDLPLVRRGVISGYILDLGIATFRAACQYVHDMPYGYNSNRDDLMILFKEGCGTCSTKHAVIAVLAEELQIQVFRMIGIYALTEDIVSGTGIILARYRLPYVPMIHCFLGCDSRRVDLTEGNRNGKNRPIDDFLYTQKVRAAISEKDEYLIYRSVLEKDIIKRPEMRGFKVPDVLRARIEGVALLKSKIQDGSNQTIKEPES